MSPSAPIASTVHPTLRLAGLLLVLAGLFGMHSLGGLSSGHDPSGMGMQTASSSVMSASPVGASEPVAIPTGIVAGAGLWAGHEVKGMLEAATGSGNGAMVMGAMCLAILAAALLTLMQLSRRPRSAAVVWVLPRPARAIVARGRDPDPPSLIRLSIQRC